jgi:hypothetical protein
MPAYYSQPAPRPGGESVFQDATCRILLFAPYLILHSAPNSCISGGAVAGVRRGLEQLSQISDQMGYLVLHDPPFRLGMPPEVRTGLTLALSRFEDRIAAAAMVYEELGFKASAIRSLVSALHAANRAPHPAKVFADVPAALQWIHPLVPGGKVSLTELEQFVRDQRKRLYLSTPIMGPPSSRR